MTELEPALRAVNEALRRCLAGDAAGGLALYARHVTQPVAGKLPLPRMSIAFDTLPSSCSAGQAALRALVSFFMIISRFSRER